MSCSVAVTTPAVPLRRLESLAVFAIVLRSLPLLRVQLAFLLFNMVEAASWVAILVYAYGRGGVAASGLVSFAQLAPAVAFAPMAATLVDRLPRTIALALAYVLYGLATFAIAACLLGGLDPPAVYTAAVVSGLVLTLARPAHASVLPSIARTPSELTAANVVSGTVENVGIFVGSVGGGVLLGLVGPGGVFLVAGVAAGAAFVAVLGLQIQAHAPVPHLHLAAGALDSRLHTGPHDHHGHDHRESEGMAAFMAGGIHEAAGNGLVRPLVLVVGLVFMLQGAADVFQVVLAMEVTHTGESGVGVLAGGFGIGGMLGAAVAIGLVGRRRLLRPLVAASALMGVGLAVAGLVPLVIVGVLGYVTAGVGKALIDIVARTMLQRVTPERYLGRVFGIVEGTALGGLAVGTLLAPLLIGLAGPSAALLVAGAILPVGALILRGALASADRLGVVHERELALVRRISMFAPLRLPVMEGLAAHAEHVAVAAGQVVMQEGEPGDCFYMIETGSCSITVGGREVNRLGSGDGFGEIALLRQVPRTATVTALTNMELFRLDRQPFLEAVTGWSASLAVAGRLVEERLAGRP